MIALHDHTRWIDRIAAWSPLALLGGLAALTWWLDAQIATPGSRGGGPRHEPDLYVEGVRAVELDAAGNPVQTLSAARARHFPDDGTVEFDQPRFLMAQPGRPRFTVSAELARVSGDRENAYFEGDVVATRSGEGDGDDAAGPISLATEFLHVIPKQDRAQTHLPVTITEPRGIIQSTGLVLDNEARTLSLKSDVRGTLEPPSPR